MKKFREYNWNAKFRLDVLEKAVLDIIATPDVHGADVDKVLVFLRKKTDYYLDRRERSLARRAARAYEVLGRHFQIQYDLSDRDLAYLVMY